MTKGVYIIHFERPLHHARHYTGWSGDMLARFHLHEAGIAAKLTRAVTRAGIGLVLARCFPGETPSFERALKRTHSVPDYCPFCAGHERPYTPKERNHGKTQ